MPKSKPYKMGLLTILPNDWSESEQEAYVEAGVLPE